MAQGVEFICRVCGKKVVESERNIRRSASMRNGCCSFVCLRKTDEYKEKRKLADEIRIKKIRAGNGFENNSSLGKITRAKKFLLLHDISIEGLTDEQAFGLWQIEFSKRSGHGQKIINGRLKKHATPEALRLADLERVLKGSCKILGIEYRNDFTQEEKKSINNQAYKNFRVKDKISWKLKHLISQCNIENVSDLDEEKIEVLYAEYMSKRFKRSSLETDKNGYTNSEKGWYFATNQPTDKFFFRSSWEKKVFEALDHLMGSQKIISIKTPERIQYTIDGVKRHYYPDAAFINLRGEIIILEIKPIKKVDEYNNSLKISAAKNKFGKNFYVMTEKEIFSDELVKILEKM